MSPVQFQTIEEHYKFKIDLLNKVMQLQEMEKDFLTDNSNADIDSKIQDIYKEINQTQKKIDRCDLNIAIMKKGNRKMFPKKQSESIE